jgi:hypothetical protein
VNLAYRALYSFEKGSHMSATDHDWTKPAALAIPKDGYFELDHLRQPGSPVRVRAERLDQRPVFP